ncbi:MAG TPA: MerR family transcriptional regulator [Solirubrobacteraceae bacterium]|jgi:MerR family redox-sensitive transcriptional activator SoxR|nr:MerR family transcriptional regulator [Solirubrobacteraceae bacterium]
MTIGEVAAKANVRSSAIRYYEEIGVLPEPERVRGQRRYTLDVIRRLAIIDVARCAGFSLEEVRELMAANEGHRAAHESVRALAERKLPAIDALIESAQAVRRWLAVATACQCETLDVCALFDDRALGLPERPSQTAGAVPPFSSARTP